MLDRPLMALREITKSSLHSHDFDRLAMASYKYSAHLQHRRDDDFDTEYEPGAKVSVAGIYMCIGCGDETVMPAGQLLPMAHPAHRPNQGEIRWRLLVRTQFRPLHSASDG